MTTRNKEQSKSGEDTRTDSTENETRRSIGRRLSRARRALGLTQLELAQLISASLQTVKSYEAGRRIPSGEFAEGLASAGINLTWVLKNVGPMQLAGEARNVQIDLIGSALDREDALERMASRSRTWGNRLKAAFTAVDEAARRSQFELPTFLRDAIVLALFNGMRVEGVKPMIEMFKGHGTSGIQGNKRTPRRTDKRASGR